MVRFRVDVSNTGPAPGAEVVQLYVSYTGSAVERAELELAGFAKVMLDPGETKTVEIPVAVNNLAYYDITQQAWVLEALRHTVYAGTSSRDLPLSTLLDVAAKQGVSR